MLGIQQEQQRRNMDPLVWEEELKQHKKDERKVANEKAKMTARAIL